MKYSPNTDMITSPVDVARLLLMAVRIISEQRSLVAIQKITMKQ
jgi:hypothetical protein